MFKFILAFMVVLVLAGCTSDETEQTRREVATENVATVDDTLPVSVYFAIEENLVDHRWQNFIAITVNSDDVITDVSLNSISQLANNSRRNVAQLEGFEDIFKYDFHGQASVLEQSLVGTLRNDLTEALVSAYVDELVDFDTADFANLASVALRSTPIERGVYADGVYMSINHAEHEDFSYFVYLFVVQGHIKAVHFNGFSSNDALKYDAFSGATINEDIIQWRRQAELFEEALLTTQDPLVFTFCENGFTTDIPGFNIEVVPFITLVTEALAGGPIITIN